MLHPACCRIIIATVALVMAFGAVVAVPAHAHVFDGRHQTHWVVAKTKDREVAIDPVSGQRAAHPRTAGEYPSPDGGKRLVLKALEDAPHDRELFLISAAASKKAEPKPVQITDDKGEIMQVAWFPDSTKFTYQRGWLTFIVDLSGEKPRESRLGEREWSVYEAAVSITGQVAFLKLTSRAGKTTNEDLMVWDGQSYRTIVKETDFTSLAWSPDGAKIAASTHGELMLIDAATGTVEQTRKYMKIDERLYAHHAASLAWSPDGTELAAVIHFSGGRLIEKGEEPEPMFGDREIFVIPVDPAHKTQWFTLDEDTREADWVKAETPNGPSWTPATGR